jgi:hypothetical protein
MRINVLLFPDGDLIGWEEQFGQREGRFVLGRDGSIAYRHPLDNRVWFAGADLAQFQAAATAWNRYGDDVAGRPEGEQLAAAKRLREELERAGAFANRADCLWSALFEQVDSGLL